MPETAHRRPGLPPLLEGKAWAGRPTASDSCCACRATSRGCTHLGLSTLRGSRGSIPGEVEMRVKGDGGERGRERSDLLGPQGCALISLFKLRERMDIITLLFPAKASDVDALARTWRRRRRRHEVGVGRIPGMGDGGDHSVTVTTMMMSRRVNRIPPR